MYDGGEKMKKKLVVVIVLSMTFLITTLLSQPLYLPAKAVPNNTEEKELFETNLEIEKLNPFSINPATFKVLNFNWGEFKEPESTDVLPTMLYVEKQVDQYSADLFLACAEQFLLPSATLTVKGTQGERPQILEIIFFNLKIAQYDLTTINEVKETPTEQLALTFTGVQYTTTWYSPKGIPLSDTEVWDFEDPAPTADAGGPYSGTFGNPVTLDASLSFDTPPGSIVEYSWDLGDGTVFTTTYPTYDVTYWIADDYEVTLTVTDNSGNTDLDTATITISEGKPVANPNGPYSGTPGVAVTFDGTGSFDTPPGSIVTYQWNFGDDSTLYSTSWPTIEHTFSSIDNYLVTLQVIDNSGIYSSQSHTTAVIEPQ